MIKSFELVYKKLEELFIKKLPEYIEKINKEYNDRIILKRFENHKLDEDCIKLPCFKFSLEESEYSEKDRIIDNTVFTVGFEIKLPEYKDNKIPLISRYFESINRLIDEFDKEWLYQITALKDKNS